MKQISISAKTYANSLMNIDLDKNTVLKDLNLIYETVCSSNDLKQIILNPAISSENKYEIINEIFKDSIDKKIKNFIKILIEKDRFSEFEQILSAYTNELDRLNNVTRVEVISAIDLTKEQKDKIVAKLETRLNNKIIPNWDINENIIGGLIIKFDDKIVDNSIKTKLNNFSKK